MRSSKATRPSASIISSPCAAIRRAHPASAAPISPAADGYANATELTAAIDRVGGFDITVGAYPERHPESPSIDHDIEVLKAKVDAGATRAVSQFFFDIDAFLRFRDRVRAAGL